MGQTLQICSSGLNRPKNENEEKTNKKKDRKLRKKQNIPALDDLVRH